jgi:hypothetical protein
MRIEDLKRWHWILIGVVVGLALGFVWSGIDRDSEIANYGRDRFIMDVRRQITENGKQVPRVQNIRIAPPVEGAYKKPVQAVLFDIYDPGTKSLTTQRIDAEVPFIRENQWGRYYRDVPFNAKNSVQDYLVYLQKQFPHIAYRQAWERDVYATYGMWTLGSVIVIGGLWPTVINLLVGAGMGKRSEKKEQAYLDQFGQGGDEEAFPQPEAKVVTAADQQQLADVTAALEQNVAGLAMTAAPEASTQAPALATSAAIRQLAGGPVDPVKVGPKDDDGPKHYEGEYYPVVRPVVKKED